MKYSEIFKEARRLHKMGLGLLWLHPRSKRPVETGWTKGNRQTWEELEATYRPGYNLGVRTGEASKTEQGYLACVDVDIKDEAFREAALAQLKTLLQGETCPEVRSGSGKGSRHLYCATAEPFKMITVAKSKETFLDPKGKKHHKWEICVYSTGRQMVLPPSVHPDSGKLYSWKTFLTKASDLPVMKFTLETIVNHGEPDQPLTLKETLAPLPDFKIEPVDLSWLPISDDVRDAILTGQGVTDRSGYLLKASTALVSAGLSVNEVLTVLTDPDTFLGACGYEHAGNTRSRKKAAEWVYRYTLKKVSLERDASLVFTKGVGGGESRKLSSEEREEMQAEFEEDRSWKQDLVRGGQNGSGPPQKLIQNVVLILKNAVAPDVIRRDEFGYRDTYSCKTPWGGKKGEIVGNDDVARIKYWLGRHYHFEPSDNVVEGALVEVACQNSYDPVKELLEGLVPWDGVFRLDSWLRDNFEAEGDPDYLAQVFRKWMVAMVMRVYQPGAKFDWMPIFEGAQGVGKSSFGRLLVGDRHFLDWLPNLHDKDSALSLQGMWGVEMGELSQFRRNELETIKAFITRTVDKVRPPYGRRMVESARRCVFFGTTNRETYLVDETGNRRFKPVIVGSLNFRALRAERVQLFAEAKKCYLELVKTGAEIVLEIEGDARIYEKKIQSKKMIEDDSNVMAEKVLDFIEKEGTNFNLEKFKITELFMAAGPLTNWKEDNKNVQYVGKMLKKMGGRKREIGGRNYWDLSNLIVSSKKPTTPTARKNRNEFEDVNFN